MTFADYFNPYKYKKPRVKAPDHDTLSRNGSTYGQDQERLIESICSKC